MYYTSMSNLTIQNIVPNFRLYRCWIWVRTRLVNELAGSTVLARHDFLGIHNCNIILLKCNICVDIYILHLIFKVR